MVGVSCADDTSTLVQVMAWCRHATSHYLIQSWPRSLSTYGFTSLQWSKIFPTSSSFLQKQIGFSNGYTLLSRSVARGFAWMMKSVYHYFYVHCYHNIFKLIELELIFFINSLRPSDAYMRRWTGSSLVQIIACRLFGAKPLSEPMQGYC